MAKQFKSVYTDKLVTEAQYLAELMCERLAKHRGLTLHKGFWYTENWRRDFLMQLRFANQLIKLYSIEAILSALRSVDGKKIYSLAAKWLDPLIKSEQDKIDAKASQTKPVEKPKPVIVDLPTNRPNFDKSKTLTDKLDG